MKNPVSKFKLLLILLFSGITINSIIAQQISSAEIDSLVQKTMKTFDVPGISVAIVKDGKVIHSKGYGVRSLNTNQKTDENTLYAIASNSKAFTAAALGILADEGKLKWDDRVTDFIPEFKMHDPYVTSEFTIKDLLTHRSGLGLGAGDLMVWPDSSDFTIKDIIHNLRFLKPVSGFRTKYDYDNLMYIVAGEVVARASGISWEEFVEKKIMEPLGMKSSAGCYERLKDRSNIIDAHIEVDGKVRVVPMSLSAVGNAAGGIYSSVADMSRWAIMQMNGGKYGEGLTKQIFSGKVQREMWAQQTIIPVSEQNDYNTHFQGYGLGWRLSDINGYKQVSHTGGLSGVVTKVTLIPELKLGIIVFTNQQVGAAFAAITNTILDRYLGVAGVDRIKQYYDGIMNERSAAGDVTRSVWNKVEAMEKRATQENLSKDRFSTYAGRYTDNWLGDVVISVENDKLSFRSVRSPKLAGEMLYYGGNTFVVKWNDRSFDADAFACFKLDVDGKPVGFTMEAISPLTDFSYDFQDLEFRRR